MVEDSVNWRMGNAGGFGRLANGQRGRGGGGGDGRLSGGEWTSISGGGSGWNGSGDAAAKTSELGHDNERPTTTLETAGCWSS